MIGRDDLDRAIEQRLPKSRVVGRGLERRIHLNPTAQARVVIDVKELGVHTDFSCQIGRSVGEQRYLRRR